MAQVSYCVFRNTGARGIEKVHGRGLGAPVCWRATQLPLATLGFGDGCFGIPTGECSAFGAPSGCGVLRRGRGSRWSTPEGSYNADRKTFGQFRARFPGALGGSFGLPSDIGDAVCSSFFLFGFLTGLGRVETRGCDVSGFAVPNGGLGSWTGPPNRVGGADPYGSGDSVGGGRAAHRGSPCGIFGFPKRLCLRGNSIPQARRRCLAQIRGATRSSGSCRRSEAECCELCAEGG